MNSDKSKYNWEKGIQMVGHRTKKKLEKKFGYHTSRLAMLLLIAVMAPL